MRVQNLVSYLHAPKRMERKAVDRSLFQVMESTLLLSGGNRVTIRFEARGVRMGSDRSECCFENEPTAEDLAALEISAQILFRHVFRYAQVAKVPGSLAQPAPIWLREAIAVREKQAA